MKNFRTMLVITVMLTLGCGLLFAQLGQIKKRVTEAEDAAKRLGGVIKGGGGKTSSPQSVGVSDKNAKVIKLGQIYSIQLPVEPNTNNYKVVVPDAGNITFSLEGYSSHADIVFYNADGAALVPTSVLATVGSVAWNRRYHWNNVSEKYVGTVTYKIDEGTYYVKISRSGVGLSNLKLGLTPEGLAGLEAIRLPSKSVKDIPNFKLLTPTLPRDIRA